MRHPEKGFRPIRFDRPQPDDNWPYHGHPNDGFDPQYGVKSPKHERHIFVRRDQVVFDIDAQLSILSEARKNPDGTQDDSFTNATSKYTQLFYRWIDTYIGEAKAIMAAFVLEKSATSAMNSIKDNEEVDIDMLMPDWYDDTTFQQLCNAVHDFVVDATLLDYLTMRLSSKDPVTADKATQAEERRSRIRELANMAIPGRISKPYKPF